MILELLGTLVILSGVALGVARVHLAMAVAPVRFPGASEVQDLSPLKLTSVIAGALVVGVVLLMVARKVRQHRRNARSVAYAQDVDGSIRDVRSACLSDVPLKRNGRVLSESEWQAACDRAEEVQRTPY